MCFCTRYTYSHCSPLCLAENNDIVDVDVGSYKDLCSPWHKKGLADVTLNSIALHIGLRMYMLLEAYSIASVGLSIRCVNA